MRSTGVGEFGVGEAEAFEVGEMRAELLEAFVIDAAAAEAAFRQMRPAFKFCKGVAFHGRADERERFHLFEPGELLEAEIAQLTVVREAERFQVSKVSDG